MSEKTAGAYFAWERGVKGPTPVKFYDGIPTADAARIFAKWQIAHSETHLSFYALAQKYPCPQPGPDDLWTVNPTWAPRIEAAE